MADNFNKLFHIDELKKEQEQAVALVREWIKEVAKANEQTRISSVFMDKNTMVTIHKQTQETAKATAELEKATESYTGSVKGLADAQFQLTKAREADNKEAAKTTKTDREAKKELDGYIKSVKAGRKELEDLAKSYERKATAAAKAAKNKEFADQMRQEAEYAKETGRMLRALEKDIDKLARANQKEAAQLAKQNNAYSILSAAHVRAKKTAQELGAEYGVTDARFIKASETVRLLDARLKAIDGNLGDHRRNVGNYTTQWNGLSYSMTNIISELPNAAQSTEIFMRSIGNNILPVWQNIQQLNRENKELVAQGKPVVNVWKQIAGAIFSTQTAIIIGVALLVRYGQDIKDAMFGVADGAVKASDGSKILTKETSILSNIYQKASTNYSKAAAELGILKTRFFDSAATAKTKSEVIETLNEKYGDAIGKITGVNEAEKFFIDKSDAFVKALMLRAQVEGAYDAIAENTNTLLKQQSKTVEDNVSSWQKFSQFNKTFFSGKGVKAIAQSFGEVFSGKEVTGAFEKLYKEGIDWQAVINNAEVENAVTRSNSVVEKFILDTTKQLEEINTKYGFGSGKDDNKKGSKPTDTTNTEISVRERINKAQAAVRNQGLEETIRVNKAVSENEKLSLEERLQAHTQYTNAKLDLLLIEKEREIENIQISLDEIAEIEKIDASKRTKQQEKLLLQKEAFEAEKLVIAGSYNSQEQALLQSSSNEAFNIVKSGLDREQALLLEGAQKTINGISVAESAKLKDLEDRRLKGLLTEEEYERERKKIQQHSLQESIKAEIAYTKELIKLKKARGEDTSALEKAIAGFELELFESNSADQLTAQQRYNEKRKELASALPQFLADTINSLYEKDKAAIDQKIEDIDREKEAEIIKAKANITNKEEEEKRIGEIEQQAQSRKEALEARKRQIAVEQAKTAQTIAALMAGVNMAAAIMKNTADLGFVPAIPVNVATAVLGATQIAAILSKPIPAYAEGTPDGGHPADGPAVVGEGGQPERIKEPGKAPYWVGSATVKNLPKGTEVTPLSDIITAGNSFLTPSLVGSLIAQSNGFSTVAVERKLDEVKSAIIGKPVPSIEIDHNGAFRKSIKVGNVVTNWVKQNIID